MAKPANHTAAFKLPPASSAKAETTTTPVSFPGQRFDSFHVLAQPHGGFAVFADDALCRMTNDDYGRRSILSPLASFTTLPELLTWLGQNMAQPAIEAQR